MPNALSRLVAAWRPSRARADTHRGVLHAAALAAPDESKASRAGALIAIESLRRPVWTPRDYTAFAREGYMQNAVVYRSVRMVAEAAASVPVLLYDGDNEIASHPLIDLIARPAPQQSAADFFEAWYGHLLVAGNAYAEAVAMDGELRELHALRPDRMKVIPGPDGWPEAHEYTVAGNSVRFDEEPVDGVAPILHLKMFHPTNDHYGMSPLEAAATAIDIHNTAAQWNKALLDNSARPSGALVYTGGEGRMTGEQFERLKAELEAGFQGARQAGRPLLLEGGLDWKALGLTPKDMDFIEAKNAAAREIALAIGVPPMLLGIPGDNTYSNYQEAQRAFWRQTVLPLFNRTMKALSAWLSPAWNEVLELRGDLDQIEALTIEREALWARLQGVSFLTDDEKRAAIGYGPMPAVAKYWTDQPRVPAGNPDGGQWTDDGGGATRIVDVGNSGDVLSDANPDNFWQPGAEVAQAKELPQGPINLRDEDTNFGGHTISRHAARPDEELLSNVSRDRIVAGTVTIARRAQGSFHSIDDANNFVNRVLTENLEVVERVAAGEQSEAEFTKRFGYVTGKEAFRPDVDSEPYMRPTYEVYVHIERDTRSKRGYRVFRAFPKNARAPGQ